MVGGVDKSPTVDLLAIHGRDSSNVTLCGSLCPGFDFMGRFFPFSVQRCYFSQPRSQGDSIHDVSG